MKTMSIKNPRFIMKDVVEELGLDFFTTNDKEHNVYVSLCNVLMEGDYEVKDGTKIYSGGERLDTRDVMDIAKKMFEAGMNYQKKRYHEAVVYRNTNRHLHSWD